MIQQEIEQNPALEEAGPDEVSDRKMPDLETEPIAPEKEIRVKEICIK
jgi:RNA polymerase sigma-54 factor